MGDGGYEGKDSLLLTQQTRWFTWHHTMAVIILHYKDKALPGWACENGSRITLKGSAGLSFLKHCGYRLVHRNDYRPPGSHVGLLPPQHRSFLQPAGQAAEEERRRGREDRREEGRGGGPHH